MTKEKYSDARWHDADLNQPDTPEMALSEAEKQKRVDFLNQLHETLFKSPLNNEDIPDNLKSNKK